MPRVFYRNRGFLGRDRVSRTRGNYVVIKQVYFVTEFAIIGRISVVTEDFGSQQRILGFNKAGHDRAWRAKVIRMRQSARMAHSA